MNKAGQFLSLIIKVLIVMAIVGLGVIAYQTCSGSPLVQRIDKTLPDIAVAPFEISTMIKNYLAQKAIPNEDGSVTMYRWYDRVERKWIYHEEEITLPNVLRPRINMR